MPAFEESFWGDKNGGFDVLYQNMKHGLTSTKDLTDFIKESCSAEEYYAKLLTKLANKAGNYASVGSFAPTWQVLKALSESLSGIHLKLVHKWQEVIRDLHKYSDAQGKRHKAVKESENSTQDVVATIQHTLSALQKAKETYNARSLELEKLKRENATPKEVEKAETKCKKATEDYRNVVEKYAAVRNEFELKMTASCRNFQEFEQSHLRLMEEFVRTYSSGWEEQIQQFNESHSQCCISCEELTVDKLIADFIENKATGTDKPGPIEFEEVDLSSLPVISPVIEQNETPTEKRKEGLLSKVKDRTKKKKKKKEKGGKPMDESGLNGMDDKGGKVEPEVDEEGFVIRPDHNTENQEKTSWGSSSGSESDEEKKRISVRIRPVSPSKDSKSGNIQDIKKSMGNLRLSPSSRRKSGPPNDMKRSQSASDTLSVSRKPNSMADLLEIDFSANSTASTPTGSYSSFSPERTEEGSSYSGSATGNDSNRSSANTQFFLDSNEESPKAVFDKSHSLASSRDEVPSLLNQPFNVPLKNNHIRPHVKSPLPRQDSGASLQSIIFDTTSTQHGSRGPSPLTIGMSDTIPLAVAFTEQVNAYFKGSDESKCLVKCNGDMMVSFPAGIVKVLTENPSPAVLSFRVKNISSVENVIMNKQLIIQEPTDPGSNSHLYSFNMYNLMDHLKHQSEVNKNGSYYNIDILKYQVKRDRGVKDTPLQLVTYWKCEPGTTDFRLEYKYNGSAMNRPMPLSNVSMVAPMNGAVTNMQSEPGGIWQSEHNKAWWKFNDISDLNESKGAGCIRAKFEVNDGPSTPQPVALRFACEGTTLSGLEFELSGLGYRLSLAKKRFASGKYVAETDLDVHYV